MTIIIHQQSKCSCINFDMSEVRSGGKRERNDSCLQNKKNKLKLTHKLCSSLNCSSQTEYRYKPWI